LQIAYGGDNVLSARSVFGIEPPSEDLTIAGDLGNARGMLVD
jgi:hypothetical protein